MSAMRASVSQHPRMKTRWLAVCLTVVIAWAGAASAASAAEEKPEAGTRSQGATKRSSDDGKPSAEKLDKADKPERTSRGGREARSKRDAKSPGAAAVEEAGQALLKEYQASLRESKDAAATLREESDYFKEGAGEITPEDVLAALEKPIHPDPRASSYVKWQLLSAVPVKFDDALAARAINVYRRAPEPEPRPDLGNVGRRELDRLIRGAKEDDVDALSDQYDEMMKRYWARNKPIVEYRSTLFRKLPTVPEALLAGFEDAQVRLDAAMDVKDHLTDVIAAVRNWAVSGPPPQQLKAMADHIRKFSNQTGPEYYNGMEWKEKERQLVWKKTKTRLSSDKALEGLVDELKEMAKVTPADGGGGLKFRD